MIRNLTSPLPIVALFLGVLTPSLAVADEVTDWNQILVSALTATNTSPQNAGRIAATRRPSPRGTHRSFEEAADEANNSRVYGGIHFRSAVRDGRAIGDSVGGLVLETLMRPFHADDDHDTQGDAGQRD